MDGAGLSDRERRVLSAIEAHLKGDRSPGRSWDRFVRPRPFLRSPHRRRRVAAACALGALTAALLIAASITVSQPLIWGFAAAWILTVATALPLLGQWARRRWQRRDRAPQHQ
ncbi:DUF3040 domain-containing protein [Streptomyces sp. NPDC091268]|uniref:DUF3040 domain-containing protein n=1 Tax=Streptomyces sp. NPDC091268 TaxID=3365979 RepID=UPI0037F50D2B